MGIDYGMGRTNIDAKTGIRYGVIPFHDLSSWWHDASEPEYGEPHCPKCGREAQGIAGAQQDYDERNVDEYGEDNLPELSALRPHSCDDYGCARCGVYFGSDEVYSDDPLGFSLDDGEYKAWQSSDDCDVCVFRSPFVTFAPFCSPCAPGAVYLRDGAASGDAVGYCFGHDWFESGLAPYPVYDAAAFVADGSLVEVFPVGLSF